MAETRHGFTLDVDPDSLMKFTKHPGVSGICPFSTVILGMRSKVSGEFVIFGSLKIEGEGFKSDCEKIEKLSLVY